MYPEVPLYASKYIVVAIVSGNTVCDPGSGNSTRSDQALLLQRLSNVAEPGLWVFRVDGPSVVSGGTYMYTYLLLSHIACNVKFLFRVSDICSKTVHMQQGDDGIQQ